MPGICWAFFILILSTVSVPDLNVPDLFVFGPDKIAHLIFYFILTVLLARGTGYHLPGKARPLLLAGAVSAVYGGLIELYQGYLLSNRTADFADMIANITGAVLGGVFCLWFSRTSSHKA